MFNRLCFFLMAFLMLFAAVAKADYPPCAQPCVGQPDPGSCSLTDNNCLCQNSSFCNATNDCFRTSCSYNDWTTAYNYAVSLCNQAGVTQNNILNPPKKRSVAPQAKRMLGSAHVLLGSRMQKVRL
ncbi:hypothetical protein OPQ81_003665 [Rhizoctonia solani]|nr:hypothetical protein OPQ81_003665 [Rhizoctonia solani]